MEDRLGKTVTILSPVLNWGYDCPSAECQVGEAESNVRQHKTSSRPQEIQAMENPILTLDTSAINHLADDPESEALIAALTAGFYVRHSFSSVSEVIATTDPVRRSQLIAVWTRLLSSGDCIDPQHEVIRKMVSRFEAPAPFDWATVDVRFIEVESEILRAEVFTDELAAQEREE